MTDRVWLVTGASGLLGRAACELLAAEGHHVVAVRNTHPVGVDGVEDIAVDLTAEDASRVLVERVSPTDVLHAAGLTDVDRCEAMPDLARRIHVDASGAVASAAKDVGARFVHISTDHLWDGTSAYVDESTPPRPMNVYAATKLAGERAALDAHDEALVIRTNFFGKGPPWRASLSDWIIRELAMPRDVRAFADVFFTPIHLRLLITATTDLLDLGAVGIVHVAGSERVSKFDFAVRVADRFGYERRHVLEASVRDAHLSAARPSDMSLSTERAAGLLGAPLPDVDTSLTALADEICRAND